MSFQPVIPSGGLTGWKFLQRTLDTQTAAFRNAPDLRRDSDYFKAKIAEIDSAEQLVSDRRLLRMALGAFGLQEDIDNRFFIRKILEEGTLKEEALANRLADDRYKKLAKAFGFGDFSVPRTGLSGFGDEIVEKFQRQQFEVAVGAQEEPLRLALYAARELAALASGAGSERTKWFRIMGTPPLRRVFETVLGLPTSFGRIDIDQQLEVLQEGSRRKLDISSLEELATTEVQEKIIQRFLLQAQMAEVQTVSAGAIALSLLQNAGVPGAGGVG